MAACRRGVEALSRFAGETSKNARRCVRLWTALGLSRIYERFTARF
jgi:hypothetical protein